MTLWNVLTAEPSQELMKLVDAAELRRRSLVEIVNPETNAVLGQLRRGESLHIGAGMPLPGIELNDFYDPARLNTVSQVHGEIEFMADGNVIYHDSSMRGSVVERRAQVPLSMGGLPIVYFQMLHNTVAAYLVRNAISRDAEPQTLPGHIVAPNGVRLKNNDNMLLGFVYGLAATGTLARTVAGGTHVLHPPADVVHEDRIMVPRLVVNIRSYLS